MRNNERYTREIQRVREENAELKELYATYRERCRKFEAIIQSYTETDKTTHDTKYNDNTCTHTIDFTSFYPYNGDIDKGEKGGDTNGK